MNTMRLNTKGFGLIPVLVVILVAVGVGGVGYYVYSTRQGEKSPDVTEEQPEYECRDMNGDPCPVALKPIIYLYPENTQDITVRLDYNGELLVTYPEYNESTRGWSVSAQPDGTLTNKEDGKEYSYLFWEGQNQTQYDLSSGFVVKGSDTQSFLQKTLSQMGLTPKEYNEMIVYWLPRMQNNRYNLIHFAGETYTKDARLTISPTPDSLLRVFMVFKPLADPVEVKPQTLVPFERRGFTVIEWGGTEVK
jgi:hypothetical protein